MTTRRIEINFDDAKTLEAEFHANLICGGAFSATTTDMAPGDICEIVLNHPETEDAYTISARVVSVVSVGPQKGSAFAFLDFGPTEKSDIEAFVNSEQSPDPAGTPGAQNVFERIKNLPMAQLQKMAREGSTSERVALERKFGNVVWADLLKHTRITLPEIARIARKGALPRPTDMEAVVLAVVWRDGPCTPYAIRQHFRESPTPRWSGSAGAIYPLVRRLEARGLLQSTPEKVGARKQRNYELTADGLAVLRSWLSAPAELDTAVLHDPLRTKVLFLSALSPKESRDFVSEALEALRRQLTAIRAAYRKEAGEGSRDSYLAARNALLLARARVAADPTHASGYVIDVAKNRLGGRVGRTWNVIEPATGQLAVMSAGQQSLFEGVIS